MNARSRVAYVLLLTLPRFLAAQDPTSAAIDGRITDSSGAPMKGAVVRVVNLSTGQSWTATTPSTGRFVFEHVAVGGPYRIEAHALGYTPTTRAGDVLSLGERLVADLRFQASAVNIAGVVVNATTVRQAGTAETISRAQMDELPNLGHDFLAVTAWSPRTASSPSSGSAPTGGLTIAGQNRLYNNFQIDGGVNHDLYRGRLPGRETFTRPIALDAVSEIQVLAAPFDVRQASFAGGLVNVITKSGTNELHGSVFGFHSDAGLVGRGASDVPVSDFTNREYGAVIGGPIVRDRAHYFLSADYVDKAVPDPGPLVTDTIGGADVARTGLSYVGALRFQNILRDTYGLDPGSLGPVTGHTRAADLLGKVTIQLAPSSELEISHHFTGGDRWGDVARGKGTYFLSGSSQWNPSTVNASRVIWNALLGSRWSNELIASRLRLYDSCRPNANYPVIRAGDVARNQFVDGAGGACPVMPTNTVSQDAFEVTDNASTSLGEHVLSMGIHAAALQFRDAWLQLSSGMWNFFNLDSLAAGRSLSYGVSIFGPGRAGPLVFRMNQLGLYLQDRWRISDRVALTAGIRIDQPFMPSSHTRDSLAPSLAANAGRLPSSRPAWSPRLAFDYAPGADARTVIRGGAGLFSGPPPYGWLANAYRDDGTRELALSCIGPAQVPQFQPLKPPTECADGTQPKPRMSYFDRSVHFPQNLRLALGADQQLRHDVAATFDALYTRSLHQLYVSDANLVGPIGVSEGEGGRLLYGTFNGTNAMPVYREPNLGSVIHISDARGDDALSLSTQLRVQLGSHIEANTFYAFTRARDRMSLVNPLAVQNLDNTALDGTFENRALRTSYFEIPHRIVLTATSRLPLDASLSLMYSGASGTAYSYIVQNDANADGIPIPPQFSNDLAYVPRDRSDITIDANGSAPGLGDAAHQDSAYRDLDQYIGKEPCLRRQRGRLLTRNSCRNPWFGTVSTRVTKAFPTITGQSLQLTADVYNVLNLLNHRWGQSYLTIQDPWVRLLTFTGYDASHGRGMYTPTLQDLRHTQDLASRWQTEVGVRYVF